MCSARRVTITIYLPAVMPNQIVVVIPTSKLIISWMVLHAQRDILQQADRMGVAPDRARALERLLQDVNEIIVTAPATWTRQENLMDVAE